MYHYLNSITNTSGDALVGYFVKAVSTTTGTVASIFADSSATPIISVSGQDNAAEVDSDGNVSFYIPGGTYHLDIYATDATTFVKRIQSVQMVDFATISTTGIGYAVGAGGIVSQATSKSTGVHLDTYCGQIITTGDTISAGGTVGFTLTNNKISSTDVVIVQLQSAGGGAHGIFDYQIRVGQVFDGGINVFIKNENAGSLGEALVLNFLVIKGVHA